MGNELADLGDQRLLSRATCAILANRLARPMRRWPIRAHIEDTGTVSRI